MRIRFARFGQLWKSSKALQRLEHLARGAVTARDSAVDRSPVPGSVRVLAGKVQRIVKWLREPIRVRQSAGSHIAIRAARVRVGLPIVEVGSFELALDFGALGFKKCCQGI